MREKRRTKSIQLSVLYVSRSLKAAERNYSTTDREGLALICTVKHFKLYIMGMCFKIITDNNTLKTLQSKYELEGRLLR